MKAVAIVGMTIPMLAAGLVAQDPLRDAKDLYASAAYEDALLTLTKLSSAGGRRIAAPDRGIPRFLPLRTRPER